MSRIFKPDCTFINDNGEKEKGMFHKWITQDRPILYTGKVFRSVVGIVEDDEGLIHLVDHKDIQFNHDGKIKGEK